MPEIELSRFLFAQQNTYEKALTEISAGQKITHWMWFVFLQIEGLSSSVTAKKYAIKTSAEAGAYLQHPVLVNG